MHKPASKRGGKRAGSGRKKLNRHSVSARVGNELYTVLRNAATKQGVTMSDLVESALEEKFGLSR
jgi:hypothetical protein